MKISKEAWDFKDENFGPLLPYIKDPKITDINFNGKDIWVEHLDKGSYKLDFGLEKEFVNQFSILIANVVSEQFNKNHSILEAETEELRISIIHPEVTNTGHSISIRKSPAYVRMTEEEMINGNYCNPDVLTLLKNCIAAKMNIVFCGTPGAGKTELLKFLSQYIPNHEKVITIEDNLEIHYATINPGSNCVELKVDDERLTYTMAIKAALRQNPQWVLLSEARSVEVKYLLECFSTGLHGLTTIHADDVRKIPARIENMIQDAYTASRAENDIYSFINIGVLIRKKFINDKIVRYIDQVCVFDHIGNQNFVHLLVDDGKLISTDLSENIIKKFQWANIQNPFAERSDLNV